MCAEACSFGSMIRPSRPVPSHHPIKASSSLRRTELHLSPVCCRFPEVLRSGLKSIFLCSAGLLPRRCPLPLLNADRTDLNLEDLADATLLVTCGAGEHSISVSLFEGDHELHWGEPKSTNAEGRLALRLDRFADSAARAKGAIRVVGFVNGRQVALARIRRFVIAQIANVVTSEDGQTVEVTLSQSAQLHGRALLVTQLARPWVAPRRLSNCGWHRCSDHPSARRFSVAGGLTSWPMTAGTRNGWGSQSCTQPERFRRTRLWGSNSGRLIPLRQS